MPNVFISYRRHDSPANARLLYERLQHGFPHDDIFMDVEEITVGEDWRDALRHHIQGADHVLVVIGRGWLEESNAQGQRRLNDEGDYVRWEIAEALRLGKRVIPVLVDGAALPAAAELPAEIGRLPDFQAQIISHANFADDVQTLIARLAGHRGIDDRLKWLEQVLRMGKAGVLVAFGVGALAIAFAWVNLFDLLGLDTRSASFTMLVGDILSEPEMSDRLLLVAIQPDLDREATRLDPQRRLEYAKLVEAAATAGARRLVFDLTLTTESEFDAEFAGSIRRALASGTEVVLGFNALEQREPATVPALADAGATLGFTCVGERLGNVTYGNLALQIADAEPFASLAFEAAYRPTRILTLSANGNRVLFDTRDARAQPVGYSLLETIDRPDADCVARSRDSVLARLIVRLSHKERWRDPARRLTFDAALEALTSNSVRFRDKIILIGAEHPADLLKTRLDGTASRYGFEFHADTINALMTDAVVRPMTFTGQWLFSALAILCAAGWRLLRLGKPRRPDAILLPVLCTLLIAGAVVLYAEFHLLIDSLYHVTALLVTWWILAKLETRWSAAKGQP